MKPPTHRAHTTTAAVFQASERRRVSVCRRCYRPPAAALAEFAFRLKKHSRQYTGRPCVGLNGTVVSRPHWEQLVIVSALAYPPPDPCRLVLHGLQRFGSFLKFLSWKKCCSPAVNTNSVPQSIHLRTRSWNSGMAMPRFHLNWYRMWQAGLPPHLRCYSISRRDFFRFRLRASACLARRFSPRFKWKEWRFTSLMMSSCWTFLLNRRR